MPTQCPPVRPLPVSQQNTGTDLLLCSYKSGGKSETLSVQTQAKRTVTEKAVRSHNRNDYLNAWSFIVFNSSHIGHPIGLLSGQDWGGIGDSQTLTPWDLHEHIGHSLLTHEYPQSHSGNPLYL